MICSSLLLLAQVCVYKGVAGRQPFKDLEEVNSNYVVSYLRLHSHDTTFYNFQYAENCFPLQKKGNKLAINKFCPSLLPVCSI